MDLVRLGLERADSAEKALEVIAELLERDGQGGNCMEDEAIFTYHNSFLIDQKEAWILETSGKYWAAEKIEDGFHISNQYSITTKIDREHPAARDYAKSKGNITVETMMDILRDKESGINMEGGFLTTGSLASVLPKDPRLPCVHYFTGTPDPARSVFKPFIFVPNIQQLKKTCSPAYGPEDPVKKIPRFQSKPDRKHELYKKHEVAAAIIESTKERGENMLKKMTTLEKEKISEMEEIAHSSLRDSTLAVNLFAEAIEEELKAYS